MEKGKRYIKSNVKLAGTVIPVVLAMIIIFFVPARSMILSLSKDKLTLASQNYAKDISTWTDQILSELDIYKGMIEWVGVDNEAVFEIMKSSYNVHEAYPYGLYVGDDKGMYFDASGWVPDEDYVITTRNWYVEGLNHEEFAFGEPYIDVMTGDPCVSITVLLDYEPAVTVLATDVYLDYASQVVDRITESSVENAFFVTGESRIIVADADRSLIGRSLREQDNSLLYRNINELLDEGRTGQSEAEGEKGTYYVNINKIENTGWYFVTCMNQGAALKDMVRLEVFTLIVAAIAAGIIIKVTFRTAKEMSEMTTKARTDSLTKLLNLGGYKEAVATALKDHPEQGVMLIIDMDNFKRINDQFGHPEGDAVLKQFAALLEEYFNRNRDIVARVGGDEFGVFVGRAITEAEMKGMLEKFMLLVHEAFDEKYHEQELSISIGSAFVREHGNSYEDLYQSADKALYEVKRSGKNGYQTR